MYMGNPGSIESGSDGREIAAIIDTWVKMVEAIAEHGRS
jgi:hypothetical protein